MTNLCEPEAQRQPLIAKCPTCRGSAQGTKLPVEKDYRGQLKRPLSTVENAITQRAVNVIYHRIKFRQADGTPVAFC